MRLFSRTMCFALVCVGLAMLATVAPAETTVDLPTYIADLQHWSAAVADLPAHPETAAGLRRSVPLQLDLNVTGQHFKLSNVWLVMALAQWEKQAPRRPALQRDMQQRLQWQLQQALALNRPPPTPSSETARAQLRAILSRREFRFVQPPSWWDLMVARVRRWLLRWVEKLMNRLHLKPGVASIFSWILLSAAFLLLAWMLWRNLRRASRDMTKLGLQAPISNAWGWRQWAEAARAAAAEQRYREAIHCCYWAAVFRLEQMGVWRLNVARTPREYLRLLPPGSQHRAAMASLTRRLEAVWYGYRTVTPAEVQSALQELENLECNSPSIAATASY